MNAKRIKLTMAALFVFAPFFYPLDVIADDKDIPTKWFRKDDGYYDALELQKEIGADIFVYIRNADTKSMDGLCSWWEKHAMKKSSVNKVIRYHFIKVQLDLPANDDVEKITQDLRAYNGPNIIIIKPSGRKERIKVFEWPGGKPKLKSVREIYDEIVEKSSLPEDFEL